jgi:predicted component of type VI protein secretion system
MNKNEYDRFLSSLSREFTLRAQPHLRSLWADVMELEEADDEHALAAAREQTIRRVRILGRAALAANALEVQTLSQTVERLVATMAPVPGGTRFEFFGLLDQKMTKLAEALYAIQVATPPSEPGGEPTESELVESFAE